MHWPNQHFNPRAPCGARLVERDPEIPGDISFQSTRPLRGATVVQSALGDLLGVFQSTRPLRGATPLPSRPARRATDFNPRAPCGARQLVRGVGDAGRRISIHAPLAGRDRLGAPLVGVPHISIHAPLAGRDGDGDPDTDEDKEFQSTRPLRGATSLYSTGDKRKTNFNPRAPCGARREILPYTLH